MGYLHVNLIEKIKRSINPPYSNTLNLDIDDCVTIPCQNGGSCTDQVNSYTCNCADGYDGPNCETGNDVTFFQICYRYQKHIFGPLIAPNNL